MREETDFRRIAAICRFAPEGISFSGVFVMKNKNTVYLTKVACLSAVAALLMLLEFPLPFAPAFYELNFSEVAVLVSGFALGPFAAVLTELIKILLNLVINGTDTAFIGELSNFIMGLAFVLPAAFIYKYKKTLSGAIIGMAVGMVSLAVFGGLVNYFMMIPAYVKFMGFEMDMIIGMGNKVNSSITDLKDLILFATLPFNLVKGLSCSLVTGLIYKRVSPLLHK